MGQVNFIIESEETHRAFKVKCINKGITMEQQMNKLVENWINED